MLILTRRTKEKIIVGHDIQIVLIESNDQFANIGIVAPKSTPIFREEIYIKNLRKEMKRYYPSDFGVACNELNDLALRKT